MKSKTSTLTSGKANSENVEKQRKPSQFKPSSNSSLAFVSKIRSSFRHVLGHPVYIVFSSIIAVYSLFSDDIRQLTADASTDFVFYIVTLVIFGVFSLEIVLSSLVMPDYFLGFYFWLDIISTLTMLMDVGWVSSAIFQTGGSGGTAGRQGSDGLKLARAARVSKLGSRAGRMLKILRLIRLIRIAKLYKISDQIKLKEKAQNLIHKVKERKMSRMLAVEKREKKKSSMQLDLSKLFRGKPNQELSLQSPELPLRDKSYNFSKVELQARKRQNSSQALNNSLIELRPFDAQKSNFRKAQDSKTNLSRRSISIPESVDSPGLPRRVASPKVRIIDPKFPPPAPQIPYSPSKPQFSANEDPALLPKEDTSKLVSVVSSNMQPETSLHNVNSSQRKNSQHPIRNTMKTSFEEIVEEHDNEDENLASGPIAQSESQTLDGGRKQSERVETENVDQETNIGRRLADIVHKRVIIIVLIIMLMIPLFSSDTYFNRLTNYEYGLMQIYNSIDGQSGITPDAFEVWKYFVEMIRYEPENLLNLQILQYVNETSADVILNYGTTDTIFKFRDTELISYAFPLDLVENSILVTMVLETSYYEDSSAYFSICRTIVICIVLLTAGFYFSKDVTDLVLMPVENMLKIINSIKSNPLNAIKIEEEQAFVWGKIKTEDSEAARERELMENYETTVLERIVVKIGSLLAIGFGEAGSEIIVQNIQRTGEINPIIPGKRIDAIFGFCDIRCFTDITEILQEGIMVFVNSIAEIVHSTVDRYAGAANKNIGDAFLLVWKFPSEQEIEASKEKIKLDLDHVKMTLADMAIISFVKILIEVQKSQLIDKYNKNPDLTSRIKNFRVRMGFGLSQGWAIEGAIGSEYKIDASYLSPHVNMASRLEGATKQYGVPMLIADSLRDLCGEKMKEMLRKIDEVSLQGDPEKMRLYVFDADYSVIEVSKAPEKPKLIGIEKKREKYMARNNKKIFHYRLFSSKITTDELIAKSKDFQLIRKDFDPVFYVAWEKGFGHYTAGNWEEAERIFKKTLKAVPNGTDGPSESLIKFMQECKGVPPVNWKGMRGFN